MSDQEFELVFEGALVEGFDRSRVLRELAALFKRDSSAVAPLLSGARRVIKRAPSAAQLEPLRAALAKAGAAARIEPAGGAARGGSSETTGVPSAAGPAASRYTVEQFIAATSERDRGEGVFELEGSRMLEVNLAGEVWIKLGAMIAYRGDIRFVRESILEKGVGKFFKKAVSGEGARLTRATGQGSLYLADGGKKITILNLRDEAIVVNGNDVLAFEPHLDWDIRMMRKVSAMLAGGLFNMRLAGSGMIAITTHYDPMTLPVRAGHPVVTDPNATVAWSDGLDPRFRADVSLKTFFGRGSGESLQMQFEGDGFVVVQPYEELYLQRSG